jgi:thioredoxin 1
VPPPAHALAATDAEVAEITREAPWLVLLDFWSPNQADARDSAPEVEKFARRHQGHVLVLRVNVAQAPQAQARFGVLRLPTFLLVDHGREIRRLVGLQSADQLELVLRAA